MSINIFIVALVCYAVILPIDSVKQDEVLNRLGSRTPYRFRYNKNDSRIKYPECKDSKIWMLIRHGTRMPNRKDMVASMDLIDLKHEILLQHKLGKGNLKTEQLKGIKEWSGEIDLNEDSNLTLEGQDEMILMAERMQKRFPNVIKEKYDNNTFLFRYTATQRTQQSARYFTHGLFERRDIQSVHFSPAKKIDPVLRFYKHCDRWQKQVKKNPQSFKEMNLYKISKEMNKTLEAVSQRLGLDRILKFDEVNIMYKFCGYETAWDKHHISPWCHVFDDDTIQVMEYYHDLKTYWIDGYGYPLTRRQACVAIKHMFESLSSDTGPRASFLFSHSGTILKILTHLGLYQDKFPMNGKGSVKDRKWRLSNIDTFAANVAFVLFKCKEGDHILMLHQERVTKLPMCEHELCSLEFLKDHFYNSIYKCHYEEMCSLDARYDLIHNLI